MSRQIILAMLLLLVVVIYTFEAANLNAVSNSGFNTNRGFIRPGNCPRFHTVRLERKIKNKEEKDDADKACPEVAEETDECEGDEDCMYPTKCCRKGGRKKCMEPASR